MLVVISIATTAYILLTADPKDLERIIYEEAGSFVGGSAGAGLATGACLVFGIATGGWGLLACGVIGGIECDYLAFRNKEVDWQIWITQGAKPRPCRYVITSTGITDGPQYTVQLRNWKTGSEVGTPDFTFKPPSGAKQISVDELKKVKDMGELPGNFTLGGK